MKQFYLKMTMCLMIGTLLWSCGDPLENGDNEDEFTYEPAWERQLKQYETDGKFGPNLELLKYNYLESYDAKAVFDEIFDPEVLMPSYRYSYQDTEFILESREEVASCKGYNSVWPNEKQYVDSLLKTNPRIVELSWCWNKTLEFKTQAIISNMTGRIDYDLMVSRIRISYHIGTTTKSLIKTRTESAEPELLFVHEDIETKKVNGFDIKAGVKIRVTGHYITSGGETEKRLDEGNVEKYQVNNPSLTDYDVVTNYRVLRNSVGTNGKYKVSYGYGFAPRSANMSLTYDPWNETYTIVGHEKGATNVISVVLDDLQSTH